MALALAEDGDLDLLKELNDANSLWELSRVAHRIAVSKGWHDNVDPMTHFPTWISLIHSEASEALEAHRKGWGTETIADELADIVIRTMDTSEALGIDLESAIREKMLKNIRRPMRHGNLPY